MISVNNLSYTYAGSINPAIKNISFQIEKGEIFGFLGPSGSGKSTTQKILYKLLNDYEGSATIDGKEVKSWDKTLYEKIGVGFELPNHYLKLTALENLEFFRNFYQNSQKPLDLLAKVGLENDARKKVGEFSKGMKMRLNFVRSFMHNPEIIFLDEPTSGLDPVNGRIIKDIIKELQSEDKTIFLTTHQMHDADELCNRVAFMVDGALKVIDSPKQLKLKYSHHNVEVFMKDQQDPLYFSMEGLGQNEAFLQLIRNGELSTIHSKEASLDEIFIQVTGKSLT
ncbi:MAG TPA: ABC transporter ATP-binding protein [Saprospiraceae bacterium]|nr:ABC transporter ATP-binding protein [Saprospiraceae bacterium]HPN68410.1 ABC transporter ATP-binding protein [Saprospiraceae bacterium]